MDVIRAALGQLAREMTLYHGPALHIPSPRSRKDSFFNCCTIPLFMITALLPFAAFFTILMVLPKAQAAMQPEDIISLPPAEHLAFNAFDCSKPIGRVATAHAKDVDCDAPYVAGSLRNVTYNLLQQNRYQRILAQKCRITQTILPFYCGNADHQTFISPWAQVSRPRPISIRECRDLWADMVYIDAKRRKHPLTANHTNILSFDSLGKTYQEHGSSQWECQGEPTASHSEFSTSRVTQWTQLSIELYEVELTVSLDGQVMIYQSQTILPVDSNREAWLGNSGTYLWQRPLALEAACDLYHLRTTSGVESPNPDGGTTYISTDGSLVRLIRDADHHSRCGHKVYETDFSLLFLTESNDPLFLRQSLPAEHSVYTYVNHQDSFLKGNLQDIMRAEFSQVYRNSCHTLKKRRAMAFATIAAEQRATLDGDSSYLGNGRFATASGEVWWTYRCPSITVLAKQARFCYSALPIHLRAEDESAYLRHRDAKSIPQAPDDDPGIVFFMEPHTHRLTTIGIRVPCTPHLAPMYRNLHGLWLQISPSLRLVDPPAILRPTQADFNDTLSRINEVLDFEEGGIYAAAQVRRIEAFMQAPRAAIDTSIVIARQVNRHNVHTLSPHDLFQEFPDVDFSEFTGLWSFFAKWGDVAAIFLAVVVIFKFTFYLLELTSRCLDLKKIYGYSRWLLVAFVPSFHTIARSHRRPVGTPTVRGEGGYNATPTAPIQPLQQQEIPQAANDYDTVSKEAYYSGSEGLAVPLSVFKAAVEEAESAKSRLYPKPAPALLPRQNNTDL
jgi:hypothetical protein